MGTAPLLKSKKAGQQPSCQSLESRSDSVYARLPEYRGDTKRDWRCDHFPLPLPHTPLRHRPPTTLRTRHFNRVGHSTPPQQLHMVPGKSHRRLAEIPLVDLESLHVKVVSLAGDRSTTIPPTEAISTRIGPNRGGDLNFHNVVSSGHVRAHAHEGASPVIVRAVRTI